MSEDKLPALPENLVDLLNGSLGGLNKNLGLEFVSVSYDEVVAEIEVRPHLLQPYGLVHGGVYASMIETLASTGAAINALPRKRHTVGLENSTAFLRAVREGTLRGRAVPVAIGRRTHVWEATIRDDAGRAVATGRVRMLCVEQGTEIAGQTVAVQRGDWRADRE